MLTDEYTSPPQIYPVPVLASVARRRRQVRRRLLKAAIGLALLCGVLATVSLVVRSEWFLSGRIDPRLAKMGERLHGEFVYDSVHPVGLTGVEVRGLRFLPDESAEDLPVPIAVERVVVYPDLGAMLMGDLHPRSIELHGLDAEFWLDGGPTGRGHWPWLELVVDEWTRAIPGTPGAARGPGAERDAPELVIYDGRFDLRSPGGTMPHLGVSVDELAVSSADDQLQLDGAIDVDGLGYALLSGGADRRSRRAGVKLELIEGHGDLLDIDRGDALRDLVGDDSQLGIGGVSVHWPPAVTLHDVALSDTHIAVPGHDEAWLESIGADELTLHFSDNKVSLVIDDLAASVRVEWFENIGASVPLYLPRFDAVADLDAKRIGAGFELGSPGESLAVKAALDLDVFDVAVQVTAENFDAGNMLSFVPWMGPIQVSSGVVDGHVKARLPLAEQMLEVDTFLNLSQLSVDAPWIAEHTLENADVTLDLRSVVDLREERLVIDDGMLSVGEMMFSLSAEIQRLGGRDVRIEAAVSGDAIAGQDLVSSLPTGFAPALEGYEIAGQMDMRFDLELDTSDPDSMKLDYTLDTDRLDVVKHGPRADVPILASDDFAIRVATASDGTVIGPAEGAQWTSYHRVPRHFVQSLIASEDARFYTHSGFDARAIERSLIANINAGRIVRGGSTISQQVVKNLFLSQRKTIARKFQEAFLTWQLEAHVPKRRIIELYMNLAQWGPDVYGVAEAARHYFRKRASRLEIRESLFLASILPSPVRFGQQYRDGVIAVDRLRKMRNGLIVLYRKGYMSRAEYDGHLAKLDRAVVSDASPMPLD